MLALWLLLGVGLSTRARAQPSATLRRFALVVSANDGGPGRERLKYADRDARALFDVLAQLGGVDAADATTLSQPSGATLAAAFAKLGERVRSAAKAGERTELIFYYSGHSDGAALLLGSERVSYAELRRWLDDLPVEVRIAILDACASGAFTRAKGGVRRAPFLLDSSTQVRGHAFLTSSSADEAAQESDSIGGSFFTHFLVSGLRGAADASGDRKITLTEAYRFAFDQTLARTAQTRFGSQHPAYEIRLAGTGDLVMTDLRAPSAELVLDESIEGRLFAWDVVQGLLAEVDKPKGRALVLAVPPGSYRLELARGALFFTAHVSASAGASRRVAFAAFHEVAREATLSRGVLEQFEVRPFSASVIPPIATNARGRTRPVMNHLSVSLLYDAPDALVGLELGVFGVGAKSYASGLQLAGVFADTNELAGVQLSGVANVARTYANGLQLTFGANHAGELAGVQLAGALNDARSLRGVQLALGINLTRERADGILLGSVNWARTLEGAELGLLNLARSVHGLQLGLLNVAADKVRGLQLGVINYADEADFSLAPLGITRKGGAHALITVSDVALPELSLRLEANYNYSFLSVAFAPYGETERAYAIGAGLGAKAPLFVPLLWLDADLGVQLLQPWLTWKRGLDNVLFQLRLLARVQLHEHLGLFAGGTLNVLVQRDRDDPLAPGMLQRHELTSEQGATRVFLWPGFAAGVRL